MDDQEFTEEVDGLLEDFIDGEQMTFRWFERHNVQVVITRRHGEVRATCMGCIVTVGGTIAEAMSMMTIAMEAMD